MGYRHTAIKLTDRAEQTRWNTNILENRLVQTESGRYADTFTECSAGSAKEDAMENRLLFVGCLTSQQHASVSQGRICSDYFTCRHTEIEVADPTFYLTQSQCTDSGPTSLSADPITPGAWQGSHRCANF